MKVVPHNRLFFDKKEEQALIKTLRSGYWVCGRKVEQLEKELCKMSGYRYCVCVASGLAALRLSLLALGIGKKSKVIIPAYSCVALANSVLACGAKPVPVDVELGSWTIETQSAYKAIKAYGADAIISVDMFGIQADIKELKKTGLPIIEDFAHFFWKKPEQPNKHANIAITSFYATKLIAAGEGGAILTDNKQYADFVRDWRDYTNKLPDGRRLNDKMTDLEATLALAQLNKIKGSIAKREYIAQNYLKAFNKSAAIGNRFELPPRDKKRIWYRFVMLLKNIIAAQAITFLRRKGVSAAFPVVDWRTGSFKKDAPNADLAYKFLLSLPLYPALEKREQQKVIDVFLDFIREKN